ncbi:ABC transporter substrate-binding protein [Streptomyces sp. ACA25]|uniref:peptide ABC transporter substrate-binding protein n=1 Tax=Streptomyces sp. ACA25 TaxID=3022596 RepID=UPI00230809B8|nr:ABC transporter substrate-binding protein [Streptomyces sp. ACA25]MDB1089702.1 ABC transporter substrate-binding protein [Streptomyces sp. ACA25]
MATRRRLTRIAALAGAVVLAASACSTNGDDGGGGGSGTGNGNGNGDYTGGEINTDLRNPQALLTTNTAESEGASVLENVFTGLVSFDLDSGDIVHEVAESIETEDSVVWDITLKDGWEFHNGEPVDADAFIRAWNYGAHGPNAQRANFFFERIAGYDQMQEEGGATELSGLEKTGDLTFTVTLSAPFTTFEVALGHNTFLPMAQACLDDVDACNDEPIGNGPFRMAGPWEHDVLIPLERWEDYPGSNPANIDRLNFHIYADNVTAYNDLQAGTLDLLRVTPPELLPEAREQFGDRFIAEPRSDYTGIALPLYNDKFQDVRLRQALSLAINRQEIIESVLHGNMLPADSVISPVIPGYTEGVCTHCEFDPDRAQELLEEAGGWPEGERLQLHFHPGAGHEEWMEAVGIQIQNTLGIEFDIRNELEWADHLNARDDEELEGPYRSAWIMSYPSQEYYLRPLYHTNGSSADTGWSNADFDRLVQEGDEAPTLEEAQERYLEAEQVLMNEVPVIPLFFGRTSVIYQDTIENVIYNVYETNPSWVDLKVS